MKIIKSAYELQYSLKYLKRRYSIGFVPTMGYLHEGHLSLIKEAREENDLVVVSIFVNPTQFGENEDFSTYPRDEERDISLAKSLGVDFLFMPNVKEMYPKVPQISMQVHHRADVLCGVNRVGHFNGVVTIVSKLFHIVMPDRAYFGLKDAQQFAIIEALIKDYNFPITLIGLETIRETDGLAKSSRNVYLNKDNRKQASFLNQALFTAQQKINQGEKDTNLIVQIIKEIIQQNTTGIIDYVEILSYPALKPIDKVNGQIVIALAVYFKETRLIDNIILDTNGKIVSNIIVQ